MTFLQDIAAIQAGMAGRGATGHAGGAHVHATTEAREGQRVLDALATQFNTYVGPSVICLPMGDASSDEAHGNGD